MACEGDDWGVRGHRTEWGVEASGCDEWWWDRSGRCQGDHMRLATLGWGGWRILGVCEGRASWRRSGRRGSGGAAGGCKELRKVM